MRTKICASYNWSIRNKKEGIRSDPYVAPSSPVDQTPTEHHTNEHCTHHSSCAGVIRFVLLLTAGLTRRQPHKKNRRE